MTQQNEWEKEVAKQVVEYFFERGAMVSKSDFDFIYSVIQSVYQRGADDMKKAAIEETKRVPFGLYSNAALLQKDIVSMLESLSVTEEI